MKLPNILSFIANLFSSKPNPKRGATALTHENSHAAPVFGASTTETTKNNAAFVPQQAVHDTQSTTHDSAQAVTVTDSAAVPIATPAASYGGFPAATYAGFPGASYGGFPGGGATYGGFPAATYGGFPTATYAGFPTATYGGFPTAATYAGFPGATYGGFPGGGATYAGFPAPTYGGFPTNSNYSAVTKPAQAVNDVAANQPTGWAGGIAAAPDPSSVIAAPTQTNTDPLKIKDGKTGGHASS